MVQVLEMGPSPRIKLCDNCGSILRFTEDETFIEKRKWGFLGDTDSVRVIRCPSCGKTTKT